MSDPFNTVADPWASERPMETTVDVGGVEVEARAPEDQRRAMEELLRRIRERDGDPRQNARDYAAELAGGMGPVLAPAMAPPGQPAPTPAAPQAAQSPTPPPAQQLAQPAPTPAPQPPPAEVTPHDSTNPANPTITAGSQAAALAPPGAPMPASPTTPAQAAQAPQQPAGATQAKSLPMGGGTSGIQARMGTGPGLVAQQPSFEDRLGAAREEDVRRDRIRRLLLGAGAMIGAGTGHMGLMLPAAIAAGMVRRPDEEATLRAGDEREQALGAEQARQRALLDQLAQRREAQASQERQAQETLALRARELQGTEADRSLRTGVVLQENEREGAMLDPASAVSERNRTQFREWLRTAPREIQQAVDLQSLDSLSATEILTLQDELSSNYNSRQIGGGRGGAQSGVPGGIAGVENAPAAFVAAMAQANGEDPSRPSATTRAAADAQWQRMPRRQQADWVASPDAQRLAQVIGRSLPGYEQAQGGAIGDEQYRTARDIQANLAAIQGEFDTAIGAAEEIAGESLAGEVRHRFGDLVGMDTPQVAQFNAARASIIATMNRLREAGVMNESEYNRGITELRALSDPRNFVSDSTTRLRAIRDGVMRQAEARMSALGYRRGEDNGAQDSPAAAGPEGRSSAPLRMRSPDGRVLDVPPAAQAGARRAGWTPVEGGT